MKRLTYNLKVGDVESWTVEGTDNLTCDEICKRQEDDGCRTCPIEKMYNRLGEIEYILGDDYDLDHLNELVKADKEGRCVVLPCKIGDKIYEIVQYRNTGEKEIIEYTVQSIETFSDGAYIKSNRWKPTGMLGMLSQKIESWNKLSDFGKSVFLTRKEAERALKEGESHAVMMIQKRNTRPQILTDEEMERFEGRD